MAINFPTSPSVNDIYTFNGRRWLWNGSGWEETGVARIVTGSYTGDGTTSKVVAFGVAFTPKYVCIWTRHTADDDLDARIETSDTIVDDNAAGMAISLYTTAGVTFAAAVTNSIIALGSGTFTVDDAGTDAHPNKDGTTYNYMVFG